MATLKAKFAAQVKQVRTAAATELPAGTVLSLDGQKVKLADLLAGLDALLAQIDTANKSKAAATAAIHAVDAATPSVRAQLLALKAWLTLEFGKASPLLAAFGFAPKARKARSGTTNVVAAAKAAKTRAVRHTLSAKQKALITATPRPIVEVVQPATTPEDPAAKSTAAAVLPAPPVGK